MYNVYVDDTMPHAHFRSKEQFCQFHRILDEQETLIQFTIEDKNEEKCLNFIDIKTKNNNGRYELDFDCKTTLTKVQSPAYPVGQLHAYSKDSFYEIPRFF